MPAFRILLLICTILSGHFVSSQNYVDLVRLGFSQTFNNEFDVTPEASTTASALEADFTVPLVLNENQTFITGVLFSRNRLQLFPDENIEILRPGFDEDGAASLYSTALKVGLASTWDETWSSTLVFLPKFASDYSGLSGSDFFFGGIALLKQKKRENLIYRYGIYGSTEAFGFFTTPIFGWYYLSPSGQFEMDMSLPISGDINYTSGDFTYGMDYIGIGRSFNINQDNANLYVDFASLEFAAYLQYNAFSKSVLLRAKLGYSSNDFEVYTTNEKIGLGLSAFSFGDDRTQLNPNLSGSIFFKVEAIYRFDLSDRTPQKTKDDE